MQTTIKQLGPAEYELEITATAEDLAQDLEKRLRDQRTRAQMKGFRPGKVPLSLVKKMYGEALAHTMVDETIQRTYEQTVLEDDDYDVLGRPLITTYDYEMDGDLRAAVRFGVRPEFELKDLSGEQINALTYTLRDDEIDDEVERLRQRHADLVPVEEEAAGPEDLVTFDLQELDDATQTPVIGKRDEDQSIFLNDPRLDDSPLLKALAGALKGARPGDRVRFHFAHDEAHGAHAGHHAHLFEAAVKTVQRREVPELNDDFAQEITDGNAETVEALRAEIRKELEISWVQTAREFLESNIVQKMRELHPVPVPPSVIELFLDSFVEDVKRRNDGELPEHFSEAAFREANRDEAEDQGRWMLLRDKVVETEGLEVTDADLEAYLEEEAARDGRLTAEQLRQFYQAVQLMDSIEQRLLSKKVYDRLAEHFVVVEKDRAALREEIEEQQAVAEATVTVPEAPALEEADDDA